jgi:hypothetical protein|tara:strand:+ start:4396 stop:5223 length:828 start_codon:yes stop_codon:yes gene_type:complete
MDKNADRSNQIRRDDNAKDLSVNLYDVDTVIKYYFDNIIQPSVMEDGERINVPVVYGSPERWKSIQKTGVYRDRKGKIQYPAIVYKRTSVEKRRDLGSKVDTNNPLYYGFQKNYSSKNRYDNFDILIGRKPQTEFHNVVVPDYVKLSYDCIIYAEYLEQLNKIVEDINYAEGQYWGKDNTFKFLSKIDSFDIESAAAQGEDRIAKATFTMGMNGFIIPDNIQKAMSNYNPKDYGKVSITINSETVSSLEDVVQNLSPDETTFNKNKGLQSSSEGK